MVVAMAAALRCAACSSSSPCHDPGLGRAAIAPCSAAARASRAGYYQSPSEKRPVVDALEVRRAGAGHCRPLALAAALATGTAAPAAGPPLPPPLTR
jgi:hypothetical protein